MFSRPRVKQTGHFFCGEWFPSDKKYCFDHLDWAEALSGRRGSHPLLGQLRGRLGLFAVEFHGVELTRHRLAAQVLRRGFPQQGGPFQAGIP